MERFDFGECEIEDEEATYPFESLVKRRRQLDTISVRAIAHQEKYPTFEVQDFMEWLDKSSCHRETGGEG